MLNSDLDLLDNPNWKEIPNTNGKYWVSNYGVVRSFSDKGDRGAVDLFPCMCPRGFLVVSLYINGYRRYEYIHRLVAEAFCPKNKDDKYVFHRDGNKCNNDYTNLYWCNNKRISNW